MSDSTDKELTPQLWLTGLIFMASFLVLHVAYINLRGSSAEWLIIDLLTVKPAGFLVAVVFPDSNVQSAGARLMWEGGQLTLLNGCDGFEFMSLLAAATLAANIPLRRGLVCLCVGVALVWGANQIRIVVLFWAFRFQRDWFDVLHTLWLPLLLISITGWFFVSAVLRTAAPQQDSHGAVA